MVGSIDKGIDDLKTEDHDSLSEGWIDRPNKKSGAQGKK